MRSAVHGATEASEFTFSDLHNKIIHAAAKGILRQRFFIFSENPAEFSAGLLLCSSARPVLYDLSVRDAHDARALFGYLVVVGYEHDSAPLVV